MQRALIKMQLRFLMAVAFYRFTLAVRQVFQAILDNRVAVSTWVLAIVIILTPLAALEGDSLALWLAALTALAIWVFLYESALAQRERDTGGTR